MSESSIGDLLRTASIIDLSLTLAEDQACDWPGTIRYRHTTDHWFTDVEERRPLRELVGRSLLRHCPLHRR
ncbi:MAG TPA: hypothetical protein VIJ34_12155 [Acidimicrobiales bacterium]